MPIDYQVLAGSPQELALDDDESPHVEVLVDAEGTKFRAAINVRSFHQPHALLYENKTPFDHPMTEELADLPAGLTDIRSAPSALALDYVEDDYVRRERMDVAPFRREGPRNDLREHLTSQLERAIQEDDARLYAFGEPFGPEQHPDKYFGFEPARGIHNIHMNQGSVGRFADSNGSYQDGALLLEFPDEWTAIFLAFQSQKWKTEEPPKHEGPISIVGSLIDPESAETGSETVTLFNRSDEIVNLGGWSIRDNEGRNERLDGKAIGSGEALRVTLSGNAARLSNDGGRIELVKDGEHVVDEVEYDEDDLGPEGWSQVF